MEHSLLRVFVTWKTFGIMLTVKLLKLKLGFGLMNLLLNGLLPSSRYTQNIFHLCIDLKYKENNSGRCFIWIYMYMKIIVPLTKLKESKQDKAILVHFSGALEW